MTDRIMDVTGRFFFIFPFHAIFLPDFERKDELAMKEKRLLTTGMCLLSGFLLWTVLIRCLDVREIGPERTKVGFAALNGWFHAFTGVNRTLYTVTDWLGLVPVFICFCYGIAGAVQWVQRKSLFRVDRDLILLGFYYLLVIFGYLFFEMVPINYRPVLIDGYLEASYPSSTTLLVLSVMPTLKFRTDRKCKKQLIRHLAALFSILFSAFMCIGRLLSGVHWVTDIIGSILLSSGLFQIYRWLVARADRKKEKRDQDGVS